jgi:hypothetical protein
MPVPKGANQRKLHKAFLRYHDANNWPLLRKTLKRMGRSDLIGNGKRHLIPLWQPRGTGEQTEASREVKTFRTQHTGLPRNPDKTRNSSRRKKTGVKKNTCTKFTVDNFL